MSDLLANLWMGFHVASNPYNVLFCLLGALVGTWQRLRSVFQPGTIEHEVRRHPARPLLFADQERGAGFGTNSHPRRAVCSISPSLTRNELRGFLHDQCKLVFDGSSSITNTPVAGKKNVALLLDCDKHVLGIDNLQAKRQ